MFTKLRPAEWLTALGTILLFGATFKPWFETPGIADLGELAPDAQNIGGLVEGLQLNVWDLSVSRWLIYAALILCAWMVIAALFGDTPQWSIVFNTPALFVSLLATVGLVVRSISPPDDSSILVSYWIAVVGGALMLAGTAWAIRNESVPEGFLQAPEPEHITLDA